MEATPVGTEKKTPYQIFLACQQEIANYVLDFPGIPASNKIKALLSLLMAGNFSPRHHPYRDAILKLKELYPSEIENCPYYQRFLDYWEEVAQKTKWRDH
jgi:hypothetical protein